MKHARDDGQQASEQMEIAFENVKAALGSVGASFNQVVKLNNYIVDIRTNIAQYREVRDKYVNKEAPPASTTIGVPQLARPARSSRLRQSRCCRQSNRDRAHAQFQRSADGYPGGRRPPPSYPSSRRKDKLMRVTTASQERFSSCGYTRSKQ